METKNINRSIADGPRNSTTGALMRKLDHTDYIIGWICALSTEYVAAQVSLDERHEGPEYVAPNDHNNYTLGRVGNHNVVIAVLPQGEYGISSATGVAKDMLHSFPNIRIGLMVGIGGGAPSSKHDIRLGDIVVSAPRDGIGGVFQYDFGKAIQGEGFHTTGFLNQPPTFLRTAVNGLQADYEINGHQLEEAVNSILGKMPRLKKKYGRPQSSSDRLYKSTVIHPSGTEEDCISSCGNDSSMLEQRMDRTEDEDNPDIHYGLIASGNQIMKDAIIRDRLIKEKDVLCFETEAAGLMNQFPCLVIRGICDYSDSHKNNKWQGYAAMTAAAYTKDLLYRIPLYKIEAEKKISDVLSIVQEGVEKLVTIQQNKDNQEIIEWLTPIDYAPQQRDYMNIRQPDTLHWFLNSEEYQNWIGSDKYTLFCPGVPGAGKTIMTAAVINDLFTRYKDDTEIGISYLFCDYRKHNEQKAEDLVANLLKQLTQRRDVIPDCIQELYAECKKNPKRPSLSELSEAMRSVCLLYSKVFIVIDALDECQIADGCRKYFLSTLFKLQEETNTNLFATSRNIPDILEAFEQSNFLEISAKDEDVQKYLAKNMGRLPSFVLRSLELQKEINTVISEIASGMFLIVRLHVDALAQLPTVGHVRQALRNLPEKLDVIYERAMERIETQSDAVQKLAKKVLSWLIYARRVLSAAELRHAVAVEPKTQQLNEEFIPDKEILGSICAGLVTFDAESDAVRLAHYTMQEYFERDGKYWFQDAEAHIATACITYISFDVFEDWKVNIQQRKQKFTLYQYAVKFFGEHARAAPEASHLKQLVLDFLGNDAKIYSASDMMERIHGVPKAIHLAAFFGLESIIAHFLENEHDTNASDFLANTLHWAVEGECTGAMKLLIDHGAEIDQQDIHSRTPLLRACYGGKKDAVKLLLENGADVECVDDYEASALGIAVRDDREGIVKLLLENGADANSMSDNEPMLYTPIIRNQEGIVKLLLEHGADANTMLDEEPMLYKAVSRAYNGIVKLLLEHGADADTMFGDEPMLHVAIFHNYEGIIKLLLEHGADVNSMFNDEPMLEIAIRGEYEGIIKLLLEYGADTSSTFDNETMLHKAIVCEEEGIVRLFLKHGTDANSTVDTMTMLHMAIDDEFEGIVRLLLENGADANLPSEGILPLYAALMTKNETIIRLLLKHGADVDIVVDGDSPLATPIFYGDESIVKLLLENGADANYVDSYGRSLLTVAINGVNEGIVRLLLENGADVNMVVDGSSLLAGSIRRGNENIVRLLLENGADVDYVDDSGDSLLMVAILGGKEGIVRLLLENGADAGFETALSKAIWYGNEDIVKLLREYSGKLGYDVSS
ncbi:ankyrin repeat-containing domain protein [Trichoderma sp. SZMC 28011]